MALVAAVVVAFVVVALSTVAIEQSVNSLTQSAVVNKKVTSIDAAEAGIQYETNKVLAAGSGGTVTCPSGATLSNVGFGASYLLSYSTTGAAPLTPCSGQTIVLTPSTSATPSNLLLQAVGTTSAGVIGSQSVQTLINIPAVAAAYSGTAFGTAIYGATSTADSGGFALSSSTSSAQTYTAGTVSCTSGDLYEGNFLAYSTAPSSADGGCNIAGNLYAKGGVTFSQGAQVGGSLYTPGTLTWNSGGNVMGSVYAVGNVAVSNGNVIGGITSGGNVTWSAGNASPAAGTIAAAGNVNVTNGTVGTVDSGGAVTFGGSATSAGTIYAAGNVTISNGTVGTVVSGGTVTVSNSAHVTGTIYAAGNVTVTGFVAAVVSGGSFSMTGYAATGTIYAANGISITGGTVQVTEAKAGNITFTNYLTAGAAYVASTAQTISPCPASHLGGPTTCNYTLPGAFPTAPAFPTIPSATSVAASVTAAEPPAPTFPTLNFDKNAWLADPNFGANTVFIIPSATQEQDECNIANPASGLSYEADPNNIWTALYNDVETAPPAGATKNPVVLVMPTAAVSAGGAPCPFTWGDDYRKEFSLGNGGLKLYTNLAIISPYGINLGSQMDPFGVYSGDGNSHDLDLIVPANAPTTLPSGVSGSSCPGSSTTGDIQIGTPLTDTGLNIQDFIYTPDSVCASAGVGSLATPGVDGEVYAGGSFSAPSSYYQVYNSTLSPLLSTGGGTGSSSKPTVTYVRKVPSS